MIWRPIESMPYGVPIIVKDAEGVYSLVAYKHSSGHVSISAAGWSGGDMCPDFQMKDLTHWMHFPAR